MEMGMPTVQEQHKKLALFAGNWAGEEKMYPSPWDPEGGMALGKMVSKIDLDGFFLIQDYIQERGGQVSFRGHGILGWDGQIDKYTMHWFDSMGMPAHEPALGAWDGNTLRFEHTTPMGQQRYLFISEGPSRYSFKMENSQDGKSWTTFMEGHYNKK